MLVILVPVLFGFIGFAVDLGRLYMIRAELKSAASAMALAAASQLNGTDAAQGSAATAAQTARSSSGGFQLRYDFGGTAVGATTGNLGSVVEEPQFFETAGEAAGVEGAGGTATGTAPLQHVRISVTADAPTVFWRFLQQGQEGRVPIRVQAAAGMSAPLCVACGIEALAVAAADATDADNFGFVASTRYTLGYNCTGMPQPQALAGATQRLPYLLINRLNEEATTFADEATQTLRIGAGGLPGSTVEARSCVNVNAVETVWAAATPRQCNQNQVAAQVTALLCGLATRFENGTFSGCENVAEIDTVVQSYQADTDVADVEDYLAYTGNGRRVLTVAIVDTITDPTAMTVLGFRQFLLEPVANTTNLTPLDNNGRFNALYIGSQMPLRQGRFSGCSVTAGPGKVVLHQ
jgi:Putative Flp pilus-assembly TadE/G-like